MNALQINGLTKIYPSNTIALNGVDLSVNEGDFFALLGANGAGKTTLIGILTGLINKSAGTVRIFNHDIDLQPSLSKSFIGVVPQEFNFNVFAKIEDVLINQAGYFGIPRSQAIQKAAVLLKQLNLWDKKHQEVRSLSGGMKRRLMIARALIHNPKLLLLDEPTAGVDVELRNSTWEYLKELNRNGMTILLTTHYLEEAEQLCKQGAILKEGVVVKTGSVHCMVESLEHQTYVIKFRSAVHLPPLNEWKVAAIDQYTIEIDLDALQSLTAFILKLHTLGIDVKDIHPKRNRLEQLFLNIVNSKE